MSVEVRVPAPLRGFTGGKDSVATKGKTVGEVLLCLTSEYPTLQKHLFTKDGRLRSFVAVFLNEEDVRYLQKEGTPIKPGDVITLIPAIAGGLPGALAFPSLGKISGSEGMGPRTTLTRLNHDQTNRYGRHVILPEVGLTGQLKLLNSRVLIAGTGSLGSAVALYLAAAGVGRIGLADFDLVEARDLQRQVIFSRTDVGKPKVNGAEQRIRGLNPDVEVVRHGERLTARNTPQILKEYDVVVDGTDNFPTRYLLNDASVLQGKPYVYGSLHGIEGQVSVFDSSRGPCYRCLYPEPPPATVPSASEVGLLSVLPGIVGTLQATEVLKILLGMGKTLVGRLLLLDAMTLRFRELDVRRDPNCVLCGPRATQKGLIDYDSFCGMAGATLETETDIEVEELKGRMERGEAPVLLDVREPLEHELVRLPDSRLIPLSTLPDRLSDLPTTEDIVVYCHTGGRSAYAAIFLRDIGFPRVRNLAGGIDAWAKRIDPSLPRY